MLVELRIDDVSGFDLSALNVFRWHPHHDKVDLSRYVASLGSLVYYQASH